MATTGCSPAIAIPAALVTACCSAIPTSNVRSGKTLPNMGKLMALALVTTMAAAVLFQPLLMGPPREKAKSKSKAEPVSEPKPEPQAAPQPEPQPQT